MAKKKGGARKKSSSKKSNSAGRKKKTPAAPAPEHLDLTSRDRIVSLAKITDLRKRKGKADLQFGGFNLTSGQIATISQLIDEGVELKVTLEPQYFQQELPLNGVKKKKPANKSAKKKPAPKKEKAKKATKKKK